MQEGKLHALFVCSMNQWRSPTAEAIWRRSPDIDVRSRGLSPRARRKLTRKDVEWADLIFVMTHEQRGRLVQEHRSEVRRSDVIVLEIPDEYRYMDPELVELLQERVEPLLERALAERDDFGRGGD